MELLQTMGLAFLGGLILNIMPCVLPVLTMKIFGLVEHSGASAAENRKQGIAYTGGILLSFLIFAAVIVAIKASGERVGWGMQFQNPAFVATLAGLMVVLGANALGVFEISISMSVGGDHGGWVGSFINGIVASVMATPCSAPFLGGAAAYALGAGTPAAETVLIFLVIGFGLAFPFLLVAFIPAARALVPRPGNWMNSFKKLNGFLAAGGRGLALRCHQRAVDTRCCDDGSRRTCADGLRVLDLCPFSTDDRASWSASWSNWVLRGDGHCLVSDDGRFRRSGG